MVVSGVLGGGYVCWSRGVKQSTLRGALEAFSVQASVLQQVAPRWWWQGLNVEPNRVPDLVHLRVHLVGSWCSDWDGVFGIASAGAAGRDGAAGFGFQVLLWRRWIDWNGRRCCTHCHQLIESDKPWLLLPFP